MAGLTASAAVAGPARAQVAPPSSPDSVVSLYCASWGAADRAARDALLARVWTPDGVYSDPAPTLAAGRAALSDTIAAFQRRFAGTRFRCSAAQTHHGVLRFVWSMVGPDGAERLRGMDFGELAADGRLRRITGFFGAPPAVSP